MGYIYNIFQANYLVLNGCTVKGIEKSKSTGKIFIAFERNTKFNDGMNNWRMKINL